MIHWLKKNWKEWQFKTRSFLLTYSLKGSMRLLLATCRIRVEGVENFCEIATKEKCLLMLWHHHLAIIPFILSDYTPSQIEFTAVVSASRDGELLSSVIHSYKRGHTIRVSHLARHQALREVIQEIEKKRHIVIITPDGPRGPRCEMKPGVAMAALETEAYVYPLTWEAKNFWELKTWDKLRIPKPFTTLHVRFNSPIRFEKSSSLTLEEAKTRLKEGLENSR